MRRKIVAGNWKMNGQIPQITSLISQIQELMTFKSKAQIIVLPPNLYIPHVKQCIGESDMYLGAQNVYPKDFGAFTGEVSAPMLRELGCQFVLVGHSERRQYFHEDENFIAQKFHHVKDHDMIPVLCVGETLVEREKGQTEQVIARQLLAVHSDSEHCFKNCVVAYEPVWAIGTGKTASPEQAQEVHQYIRGLVQKISYSDAQNLTILYGGSVNENNAQALFNQPDIDGGLVGGASLNAKQFVDIVKCIN